MILGEQSVSDLLDVCSVSLTGSWRVPMFVVVVTLIAVGSQEKLPTPGKGTFFTHTHFAYALLSHADAKSRLISPDLRCVCVL